MSAGKVALILIITQASVVPVLESEVVPAAKRGRLLVGWQIFVATGLFAGYTASYILRDSWRHQILSGAIPGMLSSELFFNTTRISSAL